MKITKEDILNSLKLYDITDMTYKMRCLECIDKINSSISIKQKVSTMLDKVYIDTPKDLRDKYKKCTKEEMFEESMPDFITNVILLLGYKIHIKNMEKMTTLQRNISIKRISQCLKSNNLEEISISQMLWGVYIVIGRIIDVGRLQYERCFFNPLTKEMEDVVKIHIPKGEKLEYSEVINSLKESRYYINKYFNLDKYTYYCISWILSNKVLSIVDKNSNIAKFNKLFKVVLVVDGTCDILHFVFNTRDNDYSKLEENTTLQRGLKQKLLNGEKIDKGIGILKKLDF